MKIYFRHVDYVNERSFAFHDQDYVRFDAPIHMHPEYELAWIQNTRGKLFIGNSISDYIENELVLIGKDIPHCWRNEEQTNNQKAHALILHFRQDFLGADFFLKPELSRILNLLEKSKYGIVINGDKREIIRLLTEMGKETDCMEQLLKLLKILSIISEKKEIKLMSQDPEPRTITHFDCERINRIYTYIMENFREEITLNEVAKAINLSPKSFCRYFKKMTHKTFIERLNEYRIDHASGLLINSDKLVSDICFESGFRNISHFNNCFKAIKHQTPYKYRKVFLEQNQPGDTGRLNNYNMQ